MKTYCPKRSRNPFWGQMAPETPNGTLKESNKPTFDLPFGRPDRVEIDEKIDHRLRHVFFITFLIDFGAILIRFWRPFPCLFRSLCLTRRFLDFWKTSHAIYLLSRVRGPPKSRNIQSKNGNELQTQFLTECCPILHQIGPPLCGRLATRGFSKTCLKSDFDKKCVVLFLRYLPGRFGSPD